MKTFTKCAAQGDLLIIKVDRVPGGYTQASPTDNRYVVAHSETGHHHVVEADPNVQYWTNSKDMMKAYLVVEKVIGATLQHCRSFDSHEPILIPPGIYELRRQREYVTGGYWDYVETDTGVGFLDLRQDGDDARRLVNPFSGEEVLLTPSSRLQGMIVTSYAFLSKLEGSGGSAKSRLLLDQHSKLNDTIYGLCKESGRMDTWSDIMD